MVAAIATALAALSLPVSPQEIADALVGKHAEDLFGYSLARGGDVGGDGVEDLIVGAPGDSGPATLNGFVQVYDQYGELLVDLATEGTHDGDFGASVARAPDLDADGRSDVLIGEPYFGPGWGRVLIQSSGTQAILYEHHGPWSYALAGLRVAAVGDVDADGVEDFAYTTGDQLGSPVPNMVDVVSGATQLALHHLEALGAENEYTDIVGMGDLDGDGHADFAIGQPYVSATGRVRVLSGASGALLLELTTAAPDTAFGYRIAAAGDLDLDGVPDLLAGASDHDGPPAFATYYGSVEAFAGSDGSRLWKALGTAEGGTSGDFLGREIDAGRDVDLDGVPDVLAAGMDLFELRSGQDGSRLFRYELAGESDLGSAVCFLPDWNGDQRPDLAVSITGKLSAEVPGAVLIFNMPDTDCDGDGTLDYVAIANDLVPDCNQNHLPDACDVAHGGASLDQDMDGIPDECQTPLAGFPAQVSLLTGGVHDLTVDVGPQPGPTWYIVLGSASGTAPGLPLGAYVLPLNPDPWFTYTLNHVNQVPLTGSFGLLDAGGVATAPEVEVPFALDPALAGATLHHAALLLEDGTWNPAGVTNAVALTLVP